jgi:hypothetical protein
MIFRWTKASVSCSNLFAAVTYEHAYSTSSSTCLQLMDGGRESGEPGKYSPDTHRLTVLKDLGARATSPGVALPTMPAPAPHNTKSYNKSIALSPSRGPASATSMPVTPFDAPPTPGTSIADATTGRHQATRTEEEQLLSPRHHFLIQGKNRRSGSSVNRQSTPCTYWEDIGRKDHGQALLDKASAPPCPMRTAQPSWTQQPRWLVRAMEATKPRVSELFLSLLGQTPIPCRSEYTSVRLDYGSGSDDPLVPV